MEKFKRYLELRIKSLKVNIRASDKLLILADDVHEQKSIKAYRAKQKARLSEMEMALNYWSFMEDAKS